jgi:hypothetical protein
VISLLPLDDVTTRETDRSCIRILNGIALSHGKHLAEISAHLVAMLAGDRHVASEVQAIARPTLEAGGAEVLSALETMAQQEGGSTATMLLSLLAPDGSDAVPKEHLEAARAQLSEEPDLDATSGSIGGPAVRNSIVARELPAEDRRSLIAALLRRVEDEPGIKAMNWPDYLLAAFNLAVGLGPVPDLFDRAAAIVESEPSLAGQPLQEASNPLSALPLAARLAFTPAEKVRAKSLCHAMLRGSDRGARHVARAFLELPDAQDLTVLASQQNPELRSLAADVWVRTGAVDLATGLRLANDPDHRVRINLADALVANAVAGPLSSAGAEVAKALQNDVRFSVRSRVQALL